ncbi:hypothetical protein KY362_03030 [Candidatus Woesearchaeota archaeon]|nr:hypothetical protein [Candidatus Woesearchaeota archaeon]
MKNDIEYGVFCEVYGKTLRNRFLEYLLEMGDLDFAVGDMAQEIGVSRPKAYDIMKLLEQEGYVRKARTVSGTQLYVLNKKDGKVKLLLKSFKECLKLVIAEKGIAKYTNVSKSGIKEAA